jgi:RNA polymerase sigma factor (sigma-70 family)
MSVQDESLWTPEDGDDLVDLARAGDAVAVDRLCTRLRPRLLLFLQRRMAPPLRRWVDVEDVVQAVLAEVVGQLERLPRGPGMDGLWRRLSRVAVLHLAAEAQRHRRRVGESAVGSLDVGAEGGLVSEGPVTQQDENRWLAELVERLPPPYEEVVRLLALEHLDTATVARRLGVTTAVVRKRYERARDRLAKRAAVRRERDG